MSIAISGSLAFVADLGGGLAVVDLVDPLNPRLVTTMPTPASGRDVAVAGNLAFVAADGSGLQVVDISDPAFPRIVGNAGTIRAAWGVAVSGHHACLAVAEAGLQMFDVADPAHPQLVGSLDLPGNAVDLVIAGSYAYVAAWNDGLQVVDISDPGNPRLVGSVDTPDRAGDVFVVGGLAYVPDGSSGLVIIDIADPTNPRIVSSAPTGGTSSGICVAGHHAYVANYDSGMRVIDIADPENQQLLGGVNTDGAAGDAAVLGEYVFIADYNHGVQVMPVQCESGVAVYLTGLTAERSGNGAIVQWSLSAGRADAAFEVWRETPTSSRALLGVASVSGAGSFTFEDAAPPTGSVDYWLREVAADGTPVWFGPAHMDDAPLPAQLRLHPNEPNPFNPRTVIRYSLPQRGRVRLTMHDQRGALVATLVDSEAPAGDASAEWDGRDGRGRPVPSGVYLARLETPAGVRSVKVTLAR